MKTYPKPRVLLNLGFIFFVIPALVFVLKVGLKLQDKKSVIILVYVLVIYSQ